MGWAFILSMGIHGQRIAGTCPADSLSGREGGYEDTRDYTDRQSGSQRFHG